MRTENGGEKLMLFSTKCFDQQDRYKDQCNSKQSVKSRICGRKQTPLRTEHDFNAVETETEPQHVWYIVSDSSVAYENSHSVLKELLVPQGLRFSQNYLGQIIPGYIGACACDTLVFVPSAVSALDFPV